MFGFWFANGFYDFVPCPFGLAIAQCCTLFVVNHHFFGPVDEIVSFFKGVPETSTYGLI